MSASNRVKSRPSSATNSSQAGKSSASKVEFGSTMLLGGSLLIAALNVHAAEAVGTPVAEAEIELAQANPAAEDKEAAAKMPDDSSDTQLDTVVIRAKPRIAALKDKPQSVSVVSGESLSRLNALTIGDITQRAGNVSWNQGNARTSSISIRGIGRQAQTDAMDPSVGFSVDGVPYPYNPLASFDFIDVANVEVLRGPQGTQGGKNANVGLINVTTNQPRFERDFNASVFLGQQNTVIARSALGGGIIKDLLAWRGAFSVQKGDGFIKNIYNRDISYPNRDAVVGRVQFLLTPLDNLNATLRADFQPRVGQYYNGFVLFTPTPTDRKSVV